MSLPFYRRPSPLLQTPPWQRQNDHPEHEEAYRLALGLERTDPMHGRVLGYVLIEAVYETARSTVASRIIAVKRDGPDPRTQLKKLAKFYIDMIIQPFLQHKKLFGPLQDDWADGVVVPATEILLPSDHHAAKKMAEKRDGHRCLITHRFEYKWLEGLSTEDYAQVLAIARPPSDPLTSPLEVTHIFPRSINNEHDTEWAGIFWSIMGWFGGITLAELNDGDMNPLSNLMTLETNLNRQFDSFQMWLEPEDTSRPEDLPTHTYRVYRALDTGVQRVKFTSRPGYESPNPRYLAIRAAVARIARMSGAAEYVEKVNRDGEEGTDGGVQVTVLQAQLIVPVVA